MASIQLSERTVKLIVVSLSILGVTGLFVMAQFSEVEDIRIPDLKDHEGKRIRSRGMVVGQDFLPSGASRLLILDGNDTAEVYIERSSKDYDPGTQIILTGEVFGTGGSYSITVQSDTSIEKREKENEIPFKKDMDQGGITFFEGNVVKSTSGGWNQNDHVVLVETEEGPFYVDVTAQRMDEELKTGDLAFFKGCIMDNNSIMCYGDRSVKLIYRPESETTSLTALLERMQDSPGDVPAGKMDINAYIKYEPLSVSVYISDEAEGSSISIKAVIPEPNPLLHKGDLINLYNSTVNWDPQSLRYELRSEGAQVLIPHGPWHIRLGNLEYGVSSYENTEVVMGGEPVSLNGTIYLLDGDSRIELRGNETLPLGRDLEIRGRIRYDPLKNAHFLEVLEVDG